MFSKKDSPKLFNAIASSYDRINRILSFGLDIYWRRKLCHYLPKYEFQMLDLATGTADLLLLAKKRCPHLKKAIGIDLSEEMLNFAKKKNDSNRISFDLQDACNLQFEEKSFDITTMSFGIRNVPDTMQCLKQMHRVLKMGGKSYILEFSIPKNRLIKGLHLFYLRKLMPKIGNRLSKHADAYTYLNQTIETFPYGSSFISLMQQAGFTKIQCLPLTFGIASLYIGEKENE